MGHGTRRYAALEWKTQRFVFLKDAWRPFYEGVDSEGTTLQTLHDAHVPFTSTVVCHEDVDGGRQETEASEYAATGSKKPDVFDEQEKKGKDRPIAPMPSRSRASRSRSATAGGPTPTASTSDGRSPVDGAGSDRSTYGSGTGGRSGKRTRTQKKAPMEVNDGTGLRHFTYSRIVVAQVCLPSWAFTNGMQLVRVVWNCIDGERVPSTLRKAQS